MSCSHCVNAVGNLLSAEGILRSNVNLDKKMATVFFDDDKTDENKIIEIVNNSGIYHAKGFNQQ